MQTKLAANVDRQLRLLAKRQSGAKAPLYAESRVSAHEAGREAALLHRYQPIAAREARREGRDWRNTSDSALHARGMRTVLNSTRTHLPGVPSTPGRALGRVAAGFFGRVMGGVADAHHRMFHATPAGA